MYFEDSDAVYDIELQRTDEGDLPRRARMYSSYMDTGILGKGMDYRRLRDSYVVFVCKFDPFDRGEKLYHFETVDRRHADLKTEDGRHIMFLNTKGTVGELEPDMEALFSYINGGEGSIGMETGSPYVDRLDGYVRRLNMDETWRMEHMKYELSLEQRFRDGEAKGRSEGFSEGRSKGISQGRSEGVAEEKRRMVKSFKEQGVPLEVIAKASSLSIDEVRNIK